jgi:hypothetical protein
LIKIKGFSKEHKVKLFWVEVSTSRTDWVATNDLSQDSTQLIGVEKYQCRNGRIQRNHIASAVLVWIRLTSLARQAMTTAYQLKTSLLSEYLRKEPHYSFTLMAFV